jgi:hypothetical protein
MLADLKSSQQRKDSQVDYYAVGHQFEDFLVTLFKKSKFQLMEWRSDKTASNGVYPLSNIYPDLEFRSRGRNGYRFAVECKWRRRFYKGGIEWADRKQISAYEEYQNERHIQVFVAIGIGGDSQNPEKLFISPLDHLSMYTMLYESHLIPFKRNPLVHFDDYTQLELFDI